jgi:parallel beta-helix repeat protein
MSVKTIKTGFPRFMTILFLFAMLALLAGIAYGADCGGTTACNCSDNLIASRVLNASDNLTNCSGVILNIVANNTDLDCNGTAVSGTGANFGVYSNGYTNVTVKNCIISNTTRGVFIYGGTGNIVDNNTIYDSTQNGVALYYNQDNEVINNEIYNNQIGVFATVASSNLIQNNNVSSNSYSGVVIDNACFLAKTKILLADGSYKNIEDIKVGDLVKSYDEDSGELRTGKVKKTFYHEKTQGYLIINNLLKLTKNHPMYVNDGWVSAEEIKVGDLLLDKDGNHIEVTAIQEMDAIVPTYNLEVSGYHNYFAEDILTHNKCPRVFTYNGEEYEIDLLINVAQFEKESDKIFSYPLKHMQKPKILIEYDPDEVNYIDHLELKITDKVDKSWWQFWLEDKSYVLKPISCTGSSCDLSKIADRDYDYLILDEGSQEYYIEFEEFPVLEQGYERTIEIISSGYQVMLRSPDYSSYPDYVMQFLNEYFTERPHHSFNEIIGNNISGKVQTEFLEQSQAILIFLEIQYTKTQKTGFILELIQ